MTRWSVPWLFHRRRAGECELFAPLVEHLGDAARCTGGKSWRGCKLAVIGLHCPSQLERARKATKARVTVAAVELCEQWTVDYLHSHGSKCAETLGWASHVLAPKAIADRLRNGVLASPARYADHLDELAEGLKQRFLNRAPRYVTKPYPCRIDILERLERFSTLQAHLRAGDTRWDPQRIISWDLPGLTSQFFDGARLRQPEAAPRREGAPPIVLFVDQRDHDGEVRELVAKATTEAGLTLKRLGAPPNETEAERETRIDLARADLLDASIVVTEFSNLAYQAALHGKRVLYCTWRANLRPLPLLVGTGFEHVREATTPDALPGLMARAASGGWAERSAPVATLPAREVVRRIEDATGIAPWEGNVRDS